MESSDFEEIVRIAGSQPVKAAVGYEEQWGKKLRLGHTDWVIEHDMLSEGHGNFIPPAVYFSAIRELYSRGYSVKNCEADAMDAQANYLDACDELENAHGDSEKLRAKAKKMRAEMSLKSSLIKAKDLQKEMACLDRIRQKHEPLIEKLYGGDIEKAQRDIWTSRFMAALEKKDRIDNKAMPIDFKAEVAARKGREDGTVHKMLDMSFEKALRELKNDSKKSDDSLLGDS